MISPYRLKPNTRRRHFATEAVGLKAWHHLKLKVKQLFCLHGDYVYLELTTQRRPESGKTLVYARGCRKCGWISCSHPYEGMPRTLRNSYDRTYLKITNKNDRLHTDVAADKAKTERQRAFDERQKI